MTDPLAAFSRWLEEARESGAEAPGAMTLVTATSDGAPSARIVSLKRLEADALLFTTALWSRKAQELRLNPKLAVVFHWPVRGRQVRIEGRGEVAERELAEELFAARPRDHQLQAHVSHQGEEIESIEALRTQLEALDAELGDHPVPCPENWGAVRIFPDRIELWEEAADRLHERRLFEAGGGEWHQSLLAP